ncbi:MAG: potassium channel protein [Candidatus Zixiibacteriota bacterium]
MNNNILTPAQKLFIALTIFLILIVSGTIGFTLLEGMDPFDSLYMTIITISTVGFGEIKELSHNGRIFVIFLIIISLISGTITASAIGQLIIEGQLRSILGRRKMKSKIKRLNNHYIIAGYGRVGRQVAEMFVARKAPFIIIEKDNRMLNQLEAEGHLYVEGEAIEDEALLTAGVDRAKVLVSTLPSESDNVYLALTAREFNPKLYIICRADHPDGEKKLKRAGANHVVSPHILGGMRMAMASLRPNVVDFMQMTALGESGLGIEEVALPDKSRFAGQSLIESKIKAEYGVTIIGIRKEGQKMQINPPPTAVLQGNDILVLVGSNKELERFTTEMV